jgi:hypothetical protein
MKHPRVNFRGILPARLKKAVVTDKNNLDFKRGNYAEAIIERPFGGKIHTARLLIHIYHSDIPSYGFVISNYNQGFANTMFEAIKPQMLRAPFMYAYEQGISGGHMFQLWSRNQDDHPKIRKFLMSMVRTFDTLPYP